MLVKDEFAGCGLGEGQAHVDNIIFTLALANCFRVEEAVDYYQKIFHEKPQGQPSVHFGVQAFT